jgi:predicted transcriptional regulator
MTDSKKWLSSILIERIEEAARMQNRKPAEVLADAVEQYLEKESWAEFVRRNERRAATLGLTEEDVPRLVEEVRRENRERNL